MSEGKMREREREKKKGKKGKRGYRERERERVGGEQRKAVQGRDHRIKIRVNANEQILLNSPVRKISESIRDRNKLFTVKR